MSNARLAVLVRVRVHPSALMSFDMLRGNKAEKMLAKPDAEPAADDGGFDFDFSSLGGDTNWCEHLLRPPTSPGPLRLTRCGSPITGPTRMRTRN